MPSDGTQCDCSVVTLTAMTPGLEGVSGRPLAAPNRGDTCLAAFLPDTLLVHKGPCIPNV